MANWNWIALTNMSQTKQKSSLLDDKLHIPGPLWKIQKSVWRNHETYFEKFKKQLMTYRQTHIRTDRQTDGQDLYIYATSRHIKIWGYSDIKYFFRFTEYHVDSAVKIKTCMDHNGTYMDRTDLLSFHVGYYKQLRVVPYLRQDLVHAKVSIKRSLVGIFVSYSKYLVPFNTLDISSWGVNLPRKSYWNKGSPRET